MMLLTVLAAGAAIAGTGMVAFRSDAAKDRSMRQDGGNTVTMLCLCCTDNLAVFDRVVNSELDDAPEERPATDSVSPGYRVVVRDCQTDPATDGWRRYRSYMHEARESDARRIVGALVDAYGLMAFLASSDEPDGDRFMPDFLIALSPAVSNFKGTSMACDPKKADDAYVAAMETLARSRDWTAVADNLMKRAEPLKAVILNSLESSAEFPKIGDVRGVPSKGFWAFDKDTACESWMRGGFSEQELAAAREQREQMEKDARPYAGPTFKEEVVRDTLLARDAVFRGDHARRNYAKGYIRRAADFLVAEVAEVSDPHPWQSWMQQKQRGLDDYRDSVAKAAAERAAQDLKRENQMREDDVAKAAAERKKREDDMLNPAAASSPP